MNCKKVEALAPLFVEGDLPAGQADLVRSHVAGCPRCRQVVAGFRASQAWLHERGPVALNGAMLEGLRRSVWRRLDDQKRRPWLLRWMDRHWISLRRWASQPLVAVACTLLLVVGASALLRVSGLRTTATPTADDGSLTATDLGEGQAAEAERTVEMDVEGMFAQAGTAGTAEAPSPLDSVDEGPAVIEDHMRIELQTRDPNVRIIWFASNDATSGSVEN